MFLIERTVWHPVTGRRLSGVAVLGVSSLTAGHATPAEQPSGLAIASLLMAVLWFVGIGSVLALVFGYRARREIRNSAGGKTGKEQEASLIPFRSVRTGRLGALRLVGGGALRLRAGLREQSDLGLGEKLETDQALERGKTTTSRKLAAVGAIQRSGPRLVAFFGCIYYAGMRPSEVVRLRKASLELPADETTWRSPGRASAVRGPTTARPGTTGA